jgi:hypothetical protein
MSNRVDMIAQRNNHEKNELVRDELEPDSTRLAELSRFSCNSNIRSLTISYIFLFEIRDEYTHSKLTKKIVQEIDKFSSIEKLVVQVSSRKFR